MACAEVETEIIMSLHVTNKSIEDLPQSDSLISDFSDEQFESQLKALDQEDRKMCFFYLSIIKLS